MLKIRLQRVGRKHEPVFRVVVTDSKNGPKSGRFLEILGSYDPRDKQTTKINGERVKHWISKGAQMSGTLNNLVISHKILEGKKVNVLPKKTAPKKEEVPAEEVKSEAPESTPAPEVSEDKPAEEVSAPATEEKVETPAEEKTEEVSEEKSE